MLPFVLPMLPILLLPLLLESLCATRTTADTNGDKGTPVKSTVNVGVKILGGKSKGTDLEALGFQVSRFRGLVFRSP